jgi:carboxylesterase type B
MIRSLLSWRTTVALPGVLLAAAALRAQSPTPGAGPQVTIDAGAVVGVRDTSTGAFLFRGIPYATPPVGELRFRPPRPVAPWNGVRAATTPGAACTQFDGRQPPGVPAAQQSEDCLFLDVWTPALPGTGAVTTRRPVMVWIHGGGYRGGRGSSSPSTGNVLARKGVVLVTFNYRLGPLGFLAHPALAAEDPHNSAGNYGLLDQVAALEWVRHNIGRFGGDSTRVTIFGESAGGFAVGTLLVSPLAKGLFHRAVPQSGTGTHPYSTLARQKPLIETGGTDELTVIVMARLLPCASTVIRPPPSTLIPRSTNSVPTVSVTVPCNPLAMTTWPPAAAASMASRSVQLVSSHTPSPGSASELTVQTPPSPCAKCGFDARRGAVVSVSVQPTRAVSNTGTTSDV